MKSHFYSLTKLQKFNFIPRYLGIMPRVANTGEPPVVVPVVVVAVDVHLALVVPTVERGVALYGVSSISLPLEYSQSCIESGIVMP